jgi:sulfatase maturation enzyme AslB (radical SAM superfamily)
MLAFNINLTNVQDKFLNYTNQFRKILFGCSIDGIGALQEYLRYPSKWATVDKNLRKLINKTTNSVIRIVPVIQNVNLEFMSELFEHMENINKQAKKRVVELVPFLLDQPDIMDIQYLPLEYKKQCWDKLEKWLTTVEYQDEIFQETMKQIRYMCYKDVDGEAKLAEFAELTKILDVHRGQSLQTVNPNLYKILYEK